jgi:hypothetical protein
VALVAEYLHEISDRHARRRDGERSELAEPRLGDGESAVPDPEGA